MNKKMIIKIHFNLGTFSIITSANFLLTKIYSIRQEIVKETKIVPRINNMNSIRGYTIFS